MPTRDMLIVYKKSEFLTWLIRISNLTVWIIIITTSIIVFAQINLDISLFCNF
ncbi:MAG: hypothetical protein KGD64_10570 [Candidatus Heimdallarchaeota archaeon]|nr:hypothetical protein [Candidatus Heimdallarchaeota archaeon]